MFQISDASGGLVRFSSHERGWRKRRFIHMQGLTMQIVITLLSIDMASSYRGSSKAFSAPHNFHMRSSTAATHDRCTACSHIRPSLSVTRTSRSPPPSLIRFAVILVLHSAPQVVKSSELMLLAHCLATHLSANKVLLALLLPQADPYALGSLHEADLSVHDLCQIC